MSPERLQQIEQLYHAASALEPGQREAFLQKACAGNESLRKEVESLLRYERVAENFMETPAMEDQAAALAADWAGDASITMTGRTIGRYRILERIGAGGMGVVYRAHDTHLNRPIALKVLPPGTTADEERKARFVREAKAASALNHPNIVTIYDIGQAEGLDFIAMEYIGGRTLRDLIVSRELPVCEALDYAVQIVHALDAAHAAGIVHRDIKPANIMISGTPPGPRQVKILDFGIAKLLESALPDGLAQTVSTTKGAIIGTAAYMSPEQAEGGQVDARSDIFSFGAMLYEMLSGRRAFHGQSDLSILAAVLREDPEPLASVTPELQKTVFRCLRKDPNLRFQRTGELKRALEACLPLSRGFSPSLKSIAVLPFVNLSADKENEYFSEGLAEEIINFLTKLPGLQVTARTSAFAFRAKELDVREIGSKLNVEHILEGSVRKVGPRIRVTAQLINVANGYHLWSERYDREMTDVFAIQDEIAQAIVSTLRVRLGNDKPLVKRHTASPEAYTLYLRGRHYQEKRTPEGYAKAKECFEQALAEDSRHAPAFLGLAEFYWQNAMYGFQYPKEALAKAKEATIRALEIDDTLAEGHAILGALLGIADFDWRGADRAFQRALELEPNSPSVLFRYANFYLWPLERVNEANAVTERTLAFDPLSVATQWVFGYYLYAEGQYDRALKHLLTVIELEPEFYFAVGVMGLVYVRKGMLDEAIRTLEKACEVRADNPFMMGMLAYGLGKAGRTEEAKKVIDRLERQAELAYVPSKSLMFAWAGLDNWDRAFEFAEKSVYEERDPMTVMNLPREPLFDSVRSDTRFQALLRRMNLR
jgi:serine/threonine-protein kinase